MTVTALKTDRTAAERQRRHRNKRKLAAVTRPTVTRNRDSNIVPIVTLCAALAVACVSAGFSITWIDNLETGSNEDLGDPKHRDHHKPYVQNYIAKFGRCRGAPGATPRRWR
jgi:hypothetical protein